MERIGLVVHPRRELGGARETFMSWAGDHGTDVVQIRTPGSPREVAPAAAVETCDVVVALGGDGTALAALRVSAPARKPVLGVACGSLGALTAVTAELLRPALERVESGDWTTRALPEHDGEPPPLAPCVNDLVVVRRGAGQVLAPVSARGLTTASLAGSTATSTSASGATGSCSPRRSARRRTRSRPAGPSSRPVRAGSSSPRWRRTAAAARRSSRGRPRASRSSWSRRAKRW